MATLKEIAASQQIVTDESLRAALVELKTYIDAHANDDVTELSNRLDALIGAQGGDADKVLNTFNEIKAFLADYDEDDTLKSLIDAVDASVTAERTRATAAEQSLGNRITVLENVTVMTAAQARTVFDNVFNTANS